MSWTSQLAQMPARIATGAFIFHSGLEKWSGGAEQAAGIHGMAAGAYPFLKSVEPTTFLKALSVAEMTTGAALCLPFVPHRVAGAALTAFSGGLLGLYARTPGMRKEGSIWPTNDGLAVSKDVWMLGVGTSLLASGPQR
ncbi:MAG: hypothetical protein JWP82_2555 [Humibacillus sp.]|nr:hypothetical protein [Humibacillus sp.]